MGKTYRRYPQDGVRHPKGKKRAVINEARKKSIPPSAWDDRQFNSECYQPLYVAWKMDEEGKTWEVIREKLATKFKLRDYELSQIKESLYTPNHRTFGGVSQSFSSVEELFKYLKENNDNNSSE